MSDKRKRSTPRWSVRAIELMIVLVAVFATASVLFPSPSTSEIRIIETSSEVVINPDTTELVDASYDSALDYMYEEDYENSASLLEAITNVADDHYWSHVTYSFVLYEQGKYDEAIQIATEGINIDPNDPVAWNNRCLLFALIGDLENGLNDCNQAIAVDFEYDYSHNNRCFILMRQGQLDEAEQSCYQALDNGHRLPEWVYTNLGHIEMGRGNVWMAQELYYTALDFNETHADAHAGLADTFLIQAKYTLALEHYGLYQSYAGVHYDNIVESKIEYIIQQIKTMGEN